MLGSARANIQRHDCRLRCGHIQWIALSASQRNGIAPARAFGSPDLVDLRFDELPE